MKNMLVIVLLLACIGFLGYQVWVNDEGSEEYVNQAKEKKEKAAKKAAQKAKQASSEKKTITVESLDDLEKIMQSDQSEADKMVAYNQAVEKGLIQRSPNYQTANDAYQASLQMQGY